MTDEKISAEPDARHQIRTDGGRDQIDIPDEIAFPRLLDLYERQHPDYTQIHEFYDNLRNGEFTTTQCEDCSERHFPPRTVCPDCLSEDLTYVSLPHEGELYAFTEVRAGVPVGMENDVPFVTGVVEIDGLRLSTRIDSARAEDLTIGDPVRLKIVDIDGPADYDRVYYRFEPV